MHERMTNPDMPARDILLDFRLIVRESSGSNVAGMARAGVGPE
jgi:DNA-binding LacI/PurR family transcriptional regulator